MHKFSRCAISLLAAGNRLLAAGNWLLASASIKTELSIRNSKLRIIFFILID